MACEVLAQQRRAREVKFSIQQSETMTSILIRGCTAVRSTGRVQTNVLIDAGRIVSMDAPADAPADRIIEAEGLHLLPGLIDDHVHFRDPGLTHKEDLRTGSRACALGGVTSFLEMPNTIPNTTTQAILEEKLALAAQKSLVNYGFYIAATPHNLEELKHAHRTPGIKIFVGSSTGDLLVDDQEDLEAIFRETTLGIAIHAEDETTVRENRDRIGHSTDVRDHSRVRDHAAAEICTKRLTELANRYEHHLQVMHISTRQELPYMDSPHVTAEVCIHHLLLNIEDYDRLGTFGQMNPSLKTKADNEALWEAVRDGTIDVIATDHAPHTIMEKAAPYPLSPSGMPGVQTLLPLLLQAVHEGRLTLEKMVELTSENPARIWGMHQKGQLEEGYDADLVLVDLEQTRTITREEQASKCGWTPWEGVQVTGWPTHTIVMGQIVMEHGVVNENAKGQEILYTRDLR